MKKTILRMLVFALIIMVLTPLWPASVSAQVTTRAIYVDDSFVDDSVNHMWNTIQEGINDAQDGTGDTVYIYAGTYHENVVANKSKLTLQGESSSLVTVDGSNLGYTIAVSANNVWIRQLKIVGGNPAGVYWANVPTSPLEWWLSVRTNVLNCRTRSKLWQCFGHGSWTRNTSVSSGR